MAGNSFQDLLTEKYQFDCLTSNANHMHDKSLFIMNQHNTTDDEMRYVEQFEYGHDFVDDIHSKYMAQSFETLTKNALKFTNLTDLSKILKQSGLDRDFRNLWGFHQGAH